MPKWHEETRENKSYWMKYMDIVITLLRRICTIIHIYKLFMSSYYDIGVDFSLHPRREFSLFRLNFVVIHTNIYNYFYTFSVNSNFSNKIIYIIFLNQKTMDLFLSTKKRFIKIWY